MPGTLPRAVWEGTFTLYGVPVRCAVLDNGQRVLHAEDVAALFAAMGQEDREYPIGDVAAFSRWQKGLD